MNADNRNLVVWLSCVCVVIFLMIVVGGVTRLTQSGLSMVDWRPIMGAIPPLTLTEWEQVFEAYKQYPEFQKINQDMGLEQFKSIFYWEFGHRLLGRVIGLVYFIPFVIFLVLGRIDKKWKPQLWIAFVLGGLQGLMGWYMVKSGLVDVPHVSHFRLAAHLLLAILVLAFLFWLILDLVGVKRTQVPDRVQQVAVLMLLLLALQLLLGAFTAGLDAGHGFNTYPLMHGQWLADAAAMMEPFWRNFIENGVMIQFMHRWLGALLLIGILGLAFATARNGMLLPAIALVVVTATQFGLGVATLMLRVPVVLGSLHQAVACLMVLVLVYLVYVTRTPTPIGVYGMKVCLAQINTTPGDFTGNLEKVQSGIEAASKAQADLVVFPELTLPGYLSQDLIYNPDFIERNLQAMEEVVEMSRHCNPNLHIVIGYIGKNTGIGKPFTNLAGVINKGGLAHIYQKQLLPFYDVFDELRYFEPGNELTVFNIGSVKVGLAICEDLWNDKGSDDYRYADNPLEKYLAAGVDVLVSINSSPFVHGKCQQRLDHIAPATSDGPAIVYVNQCGGQDELVFDGQSFVANLGAVRYMSANIFNDSFDVVEIFDETRSVPDADKTETVPLADLLVLGLRDYVQKSGFSQIVLASSGGVDSAVVCKLACDAVGAENVHAIRMPSIFSSPHSRDDAKLLHENLGCWDYEVPIEHESLVQSLNEHFSVHDDSENIVVRKVSTGSYSALADENIQARLRDVYLMHFSNAYGAMPLSTGNKTESGCGYYTHFDMSFSYAPIKDLYKFEVVDVASGDARIPENIWQKPPSAELAVGQTDEESLLPYALLDPIVMSYVEDYVTSFERFRDWVSTPARQKITGNIQTLMDWLDREGAVNDYERIVSLIGRMEYKRRQTCPGTKVSKVAFGIGRRIPIVERWS